jgi:hypothetical protein
VWKFHYSTLESLTAPDVSEADGEGEHLVLVRNPQHTANILAHNLTSRSSFEKQLPCENPRTDTRIGGQRCVNAAFPTGGAYDGSAFVTTLIGKSDDPADEEAAPKTVKLKR